MSTKLKLWSAFKSGDFETLTSALEVFLNEVQNCEEVNEEGNREVEKSPVIRKGDVKKMVNDPDEDGNTMLHMAAINGYRETVW